jgi:ABC-type Co2+ transport system permease subunit
MLSDPNQQRTIIPRQSAQDLLITFAWVFFVVIFFVGVFFFTINLTRVLSKKKTRKLAYGLGAFMGFLLMLMSIGIGIPTITSITQAGETKVDRVVDPYVLLPE